MRIENLQNENRKYAKSIGNFHVLEYVQDASFSPMNAMNQYFISKMNVEENRLLLILIKTIQLLFSLVPCSGWVVMYKPHQA